MKKLFENVEGNRFKLITESTDEPTPKSTLVREGLKKVLASGGKELSYKQLETVGMGYIRSIEEAKKCALKEARELALEFGYADKEEEQKFIKEELTDPVTASISSAMSAAGWHGDTSNPEEKREVEIAKEIKYLLVAVKKMPDKIPSSLNMMETLIDELIEMHRVK